MKNLQELFVDQLKDVHNAEKQLVRALPRMAKAATAAKLRKAFEDHLAVTREQVERLDAVFEQVGARPGRKKCAAMEGLVQEGQELIEQSPPAEVLDAGLIAAAQRVEHYEIAAYGTLRSYAKTLGHKAAVKLLEKTLKEEEATDKLLSELAEGGVNRDAVEPADEGRGGVEKGLVGKAIRAVAEATGLAAEEPRKPKARKGTGRKKGG
jgi:ferritin-like metal-binding protein YciE